MMGFKNLSFLSALIGAIFLNLTLLFSPRIILAEIIINEFSSKSDPEWVELYNSSSDSIDLSGWKIKDANSSDSDDINLESCILGNGFRLFSHSSGWLNDGGDIISLLNMESILVGEEVAYGSSGEITAPNASQSVGRDPDGVGDWIVFDNPNPINSICILSPTPTSIVLDKLPDYEVYLNELMPDPINSDEALKPDGEWVEIYNPAKIDLMEFVLQDEAGHNLVINSDNSESYNSGVYWVIYRNASSFSLNNTGDSLILSKDDYQIDDMVYDEVKVGKSWAKIGGDWCLANPSKGSSNGGCWSEDEENNEPTSTPTSTQTPTPKTGISPKPSSRNKARVLSASDEAQASNSASGSAFFDLWKGNENKEGDSDGDNNDKSMLKFIPWIFISLGIIFFSIGGAMYFWKKKDNKLY